MRKKIGHRPTKLTPELQKQVVQLLEAGNYAVTVCNVVGVSEVQFYDWINRGKAGEQPFADFAAAVRQASAKAESAALGDVRAGGLGWQGSAWFLERRFRTRWAKNTDLGMTSSQAVQPPSVEPEPEPSQQSD